MFRVGRIRRASAFIPVVVFLWGTAAASARNAFTLPVRSGDLKSIHREGRNRFYRRLEDLAPGFLLEAGDSRLLLTAEKQLPELYNRLMNSYFWIQDWTGLDAESFRKHYWSVSEHMARELLDSIPGRRLIPEVSPLRILLRSAGYAASRASPQLRRFIRGMNHRIMAQWAFDELGIPGIHSIAEGEKIRIAVIDTGIDPSIKELRARSSETWNLLDGDLPAGGKGKHPYDLDGHGTSVASLINRVAPRAELLIVKFFDRESMMGFPSSRWTGYLIAAALRWAVFHGADVINLSATISRDFFPIQEAIRFCWERNIPVITPMGNEAEAGGRGGLDFPAAYPWTIAVGGVEKIEGGLRVWPLSARGGYVDVVAPAIGIRVEVPLYRGRPRSSSLVFGNSYSTAFVSGATALILGSMPVGQRTRLAKHPGALCERIRDILRRTASLERLGVDTPDRSAGYGMIDIEKAVRMAGKRRSPFGWISF